MKNSRIPAIGCGILLGILLTTAAFTEPAPHQEAKILDVVHLKISEVPSLIGQARNNLRAYSCHQQKLVLVPVEIDSYSKSGKLNLDIEEGILQTPPPEIATNDLLLVMAADLGQVCPREETKKKMHEAMWWRLGFKRRNSSIVEWLYLAESPHPEPLPLPYTSYDPKKDEIKTLNYYLGFDTPLKPDRFGWTDDKGALGPNLLNQISVRFHARFLGIIPFHVTQDDFTNRLVGYRAGPLCIVKRVESTLNLPFSVMKYSTRVDYSFYSNSFEHEVRISIPPNGDLAVKRAGFEISLAFADREAPVTLFLPEKKTFEISAQLKPGIYTLQESPPPSWVQFSSGGKNGSTFMSYVRFPDGAKGPFSTENMLYRQKFPKADMKIYRGLLQCNVKQKIIAGEQTFNVHVFAIPAKDLNPPFDAETMIDDIFNDPLELAESVPEKFK